MGFSKTNFTQGGLNLFTEVGARSARLEREFNVATALHVLDILNERGKAYQAEVLRCVERSNR